MYNDYIAVQNIGYHVGRFWAWTVYNVYPPENTDNGIRIICSLNILEYQIISFNWNLSANYNQLHKIADVFYVDYYEFLGIKM